ncbi:MAG: nucleotide exchange factor GrpE [Verrucomicrobiota bacterium]|nr:nucleotide exchange factor GrpE [Verrucomicrobiota bacterium]
MNKNSEQKDNEEIVSEDKLDEDNAEQSFKVEEKLEKAYAQNESIQNKYLRAVADLENLRKRMIRERDDAIQRTKIQIFNDLLPVLDSFKLGLTEAQKSDEGKEVVHGFSLAMNQLEETVGEYGLEIIEPSEEKFDPNIHEAVSYEESTEFEEELVIKTIRTGYRLKGNLLRPASVILSKKPEAN